MTLTRAIHCSGEDEDLLELVKEIQGGEEMDT